MSKKGRKRHSGSKKAPIAVVAPIVIAAVEAGRYAIGGDMKNASYVITGIDGEGRFQTSRIVRTYAPVAAGVLIHKAAAKLRVNQMLPKWVPFGI